MEQHTPFLINSGPIIAITAQNPVTMPNIIGQDRVILLNLIS